MRGDRTVHAEGVDHGNRVEIVRYDRAGKWFREEFTPDGRVFGHLSLTIADAVTDALWLREHGGIVHLSRVGGGRFDSLVKRIDTCPGFSDDGRTRRCATCSLHRSAHRGRVR